VWSYSFSSSKKAWLTLTITLVPMALLNVVLLVQRSLL
jgi:heme exporter protein D